MEPRLLPPFSYTTTTSINTSFDTEVDLTMKQTAKNKLMSQLDPVKWHDLEDDSIIMVGIKKEMETKTCQTTLGDLKRHILNEILEELRGRKS